MLKSLAIRGFKSLSDTGPVELAPMTVLFGPNAAGKSNFLDAVLVLSRLASERTVADAMSKPVRGQPLEAFEFPPAGLPGLLKEERAHFELEAELECADMGLRYRVRIAIRPTTGALGVDDEYLAVLGRDRQPKGAARIERVGDVLRIRRKSKLARPIEERAGLGLTQLSDRRFSGVEYRAIERAREELSSWRTYYLDPLLAMRVAQPPVEVTDIGPLGEHLAPFLHRLRSEQPRKLDSVRRTLRALIPSVEDLSVDLDEKRGVLDIEIHQGGVPFSSRIISEGTLRILGLASLAANPWSGSVIAFEEPENGVHPRRIELVAQLLAAIATDPGRPRQVIVTTHSPVFSGAALRLAKEHPEAITLYRVRREGQATRFGRFLAAGPLFTDAAVRQALTAPEDDAAVLEAALVRGWVDE